MASTHLPHAEEARRRRLEGRTPLGPIMSQPEPLAPTRDFSALRRILAFVRPFRLRLGGAMLAVVVAAATVLALGQGLRFLIDGGFRSGETAPLDRAVFILIFVVIILAASTYCRFYLVSWIGERVVADLRRSVFDRVVTLSPAYFQ